MEETAYDIRQADTLAAWQQALAEVPQTPALSGALLRRRADLFGRFAAWYGRLRRRPRAERRRWQRQLGLSLAGIALLLAMNGAPVGAIGPAATITVTNGTSTVANGDGCSLPEAIINANANNQSGSTDCVSGTVGLDIISLQTNVTLTTVNNTTTGDNGLPVVSSAIAIEGNGNTISRQAGSPNFRIMKVSSGANLTLNSVAISGGVTATGGAIYSSAPAPGPTVAILNSTISGNSTSSSGGGIRADSTTLTISNSTLSGNTSAYGGALSLGSSQVTVSNSTLSGNTASGGGGINALSSGLTITNSTFSGNSASGGGGGGGIRALVSTVTVANSTLSGNSAQFGGGIISNATVTVVNSTIAGNSASSGGGGIYRVPGTPFSVQNSIVALQTAGGDCNTALTSGGYNIASGTSCGFTGTGDLQNVTSGSLALGALASNGGPTQTRALGFGSVALDHIPVGALEANGCVAGTSTDQRGLPRAGGVNAGGSACDVGAYEAQTPPLAVTLASFDAQAIVDRIQLSWETVSEANNAGFNLYRSASPAAPDALLAYVPSQAPGSTQGASYSFDDTEVAAGQTWYYWLEDVDLSGATSLHGPVSATLQAPTAVTLAALQAQAANPGSVTSWGALVAALIAAAGILGVRRRSRVR